MFFGMKRRAFYIVLGLLAAWVVFYWGLPWCLTVSLEELPVSAVVTDRDGNVLRRMLVEKRFRHEPVLLEHVPQSLITATLAAEDKRFFDHGGIDSLALCRSIFLQRCARSGASTITQQLVKISRPPRSRNVLTKVQEMLLARQVEMRFSKAQILEMYLNRLDYGGLTRGCAAASEFYFQKPPRALSLAESALLAGLPQAPSRLNPLRNPQAAKQRQMTVLSRLQNVGKFTETEILQAEREPWTLRSATQEPLAPHVVQMALRAGNSTRLQTTIDGDLQRHVEAVLRREVAGLWTRNVRNAAAVVIDNRTGEILALAGSSDFTSPQAGQINGALWPRSAGSTLKPFTYLLAFEKGAFPGDIIADVNARYPDSGGFFTPANYDRTYHGPVALRDALANSYNAAAVRLLHQNGGAVALLKTLQTLEFQRLKNDAAFYGLGLTIGNAEVRLLDLTNAYACIARMGEFRPWKLLLNTPDRSATRRIFSPESCYLLADVLSDNQARTPAFGSQSALRFTFRVGAKTGTSTDFRDNWCMLFTPQFTVGVWMGNHNGTPMRAVSGVTGAANAANAIMSYLAERTPPTWYAQPPEILRARIDKRTGRVLAASSVVEVDPQWISDEYFRYDAPPALAQQQDYDEQGRAILSAAVYAEWFRGPSNRFSAGITIPDSEAAIPPRITHPLPHRTYFLDPELPGGGQRLPLESNLAVAAQWSSPTLQIDSENCALLEPGTHDIVLKNKQSGVETRTRIRVEKR